MSIPSWEWSSLLQKEKSLEFFVDVTIPAAIRRNEHIPHAVIICKYPRLTQFIATEMSNILKNKQLIFQETIGTQPGDVCALFSSLQDGAVLIFSKENALSKLNKEAFDVFSQIVSSGSATVTLGKGITARTCTLEFPKVTVIVFLDSSQEFEKPIKKCFEYVIDIGAVSANEYCLLEIQAIAKESNMNLSKGSIEKIANKANNDYRIAGRYVRWIRDYMLVHDEKFSLIPLEYVEKVISLYC